MNQQQKIKLSIACKQWKYDFKINAHENVSNLQQLWLAMPPVIKLKIKDRKQEHTYVN